MFESNSIQIVELNSGYRNWACRLLEQEWEDTIVVTRGRPIDAAKLPGFVALRGDRPVGLITYQISHSSCEIVTLNSLQPRLGIGSSLVTAVREVAVSQGCRRLWLITTNDNLQALRFYQKRGFSLAALHKNAIVFSRRMKPTIPEMGFDRIPIRDEIELESFLNTKEDNPAIVGIHHAQITVSKGREKEALLFYSEVLGLAEIAMPTSLQTTGSIWLRAGDSDLHLLVEDKEREARNKTYAAYIVTNLQILRERLEKRGISTEELPQIPGFTRIQFQDPFNNWVELLEVN